MIIVSFNNEVICEVLENAGQEEELSIFLYSEYEGNIPRLKLKKTLRKRT